MKENFKRSTSFDDELKDAFSELQYQKFSEDEFLKTMKFADQFSEKVGELPKITQSYIHCLALANMMNRVCGLMGEELADKDEIIKALCNGADDVRIWYKEHPDDAEKAQKTLCQMQAIVEEHKLWRRNVGGV